MSEGRPRDTMNTDPTASIDRFSEIAKIVRNEALIEAGPTQQFLSPDCLQEPGGSIYYGTGLTTPKAISEGLPFDMLGMMLTA